jgi:hypothetical protein
MSNNSLLHKIYAKKKKELVKSKFFPDFFQQEQKNFSDV